MIDAFMRGLRKLADELHVEVANIADESARQAYDEFNRDLLGPLEARVAKTEERLRVLEGEPS